MSKKLTYPLAYCFELDSVIPPDNARDAHASFLNHDKTKDFHFYCHDEKCGCRMKGIRIHRWEINSGRAYYSLWPKELHTQECRYKHLNNKTSTGGGTTEKPEHYFEDSYPGWLLTDPTDDQIPYHFDFNQPLPPLKELLAKIRVANNQNIDWHNLPISDLRIIVESYEAMKTDIERNKHRLKIDNDLTELKYTNRFSIFKWLPKSDGKYSHIYSGRIRNKRVHDENDYYTFCLDWTLEDNIFRVQQENKTAKLSFKIFIDKAAIQDSYLLNLIEENINGKIWNEASFYAIDPICELVRETNQPFFKVTINNPRHLVIRVTS